MASKLGENLIRRSLKCLRGDNISAIRSRPYDRVSGIENNDSLKNSKMFELLSRKKLRLDGSEASVLLKKTLPAMSSPSLNYFVMQYLFNTKHQVGFDPIRALSHFIVPRGQEVKEHSNQGLGDEEISNEKVSASGSSNTRLSILKMRAARRTKPAGSEDTPQLE